MYICKFFRRCFWALNCAVISCAFRALVAAVTVAVLLPLLVHAQEPAVQPGATTQLSEKRDLDKQGTKPHVTVPLDETTGCVLPIEWNSLDRRKLTVRLSINGSEPLPFQLDSGYDGGLIIYTWAAQIFQVRAKPTPNHQTATTDIWLPTEPFTFVSPATTESHNIRGNASGARLAVAPPQNTGIGGRRIAGVMGAQFFSNGTVKIDFDSEELVYYPRPNAPLTNIHADEAFTLPFVKPTVDSGLDKWVNVTLAPNYTIPMAIDTGADISQITPEMAVKLTPIDSVGGIVGDNHNEHPTKELLIENIALGSSVIPMMQVVSNPTTGMARLGLDILCRYNIIIDSRNGYITFLPRKHIPNMLRGDTGIHAALQDGKWFITDCAPNSPGASAGLESGDRLVSANGVPLTSGDPLTVDAIVNGYAWTPVELAIDRLDDKGNAKHLTKILYRDSLFSLLRHSPAGITVLKPENQFANIVEVEPGSAAEAAGLVNGDTIEAVNGKDTKRMSPSELANALQIESAGGINLAVLSGSKDIRNVKVALHPAVAPTN